jgi:DNA helicase TIP49 (TBP-interacting protein)
MSVLIEGAAFTGKTALAASSAVNSGFPFVRKICADEMVSSAMTTIITCHTALVTMLTGTPTDL